LAISSLRKEEALLLSEGEAAAQFRDGAAEFFGGFNPFLNDEFYVGESFLAAPTFLLPAGTVVKLVFRFGGDARCVAKEFHEPVALGFSRLLPEKVSSRFNDTNFFRDGGSNPLVQGHAVLFRQALGRFLDGMRKLQWISSSTHGSIRRVPRRSGKEK
jgi:hypothetical protein